MFPLSLGALFLIPAIKNEDKSKAITVTLAIAGGMTLVYSLGIMFYSNEFVKKTGKTLDGKIVDDYEKGIYEKYPNTNLFISYGNINKNYTSDNNGIVSVNLVDDFNLIKFQYPKTIYLTAKALDKKINKSFHLKTKDWTVPFIKIDNDGIPVETEKNNKLVKLGELKSGEEYKILNEGNDLIKINFNGEEGYIPKDAGTKFWAVENYLELKK